jgi:serine/threonine protein kinase
MKRKYYSWDDCIALREVQSLRKLRHPNIVRLKEIIRENDRLHMVFEHMDCNLYELTKSRRKPLPEDQIRSHIWQIQYCSAFQSSPLLPLPPPQLLFCATDVPSLTHQAPILALIPTLEPRPLTSP